MFIASHLWPCKTTVVVRAMRGSECITGAAAEDPWWAAWKCCTFMIARMEGRKC